MNYRSGISLKSFSFLAVALVITSCLAGTIYGFKTNDFEVKSNINKQNTIIDYEEIKIYSLDKYSETIKNDYYSNLKQEYNDEIKIYYYDKENEKYTDNHFKIYIHEGNLYTYDSSTGFKENITIADKKINNIILSKINNSNTSDYLVALVADENIIYVTKYIYEEKKLTEFKSIDVQFDIMDILNMKNYSTDGESIYLIDNSQKMYELYENNNEEYEIIKKELFNNDMKLYSYKIGSNTFYVNFDGTISYNKKIILKDTNGSIIFANQIITDCTSIDKDEYMMYIIDYRGMMYRRKIDSSFDLENNKFEIIGKIKGINFETNEKGIKKMNILFNNDNEETLQASTEYKIYKIVE